MGWLDKPLGRAVMASENDTLANLLQEMPPLSEALCIAPQSYAPTFALLAQHSRHFYVLAPAAGHGLEGEPGSTRRPERIVWGLPEVLPFSSRKLNLVVLVHCLEFSCSPYAILAETERVLAPDGQLVLLVFNPLSCFGLARLTQRRKGDNPWWGQLHPPTSVRRMIESTGLVYEGSRYFFWRPPINREGILRGLGYLDRLAPGNWLPIGGIGCFQARKEEPGLTLLGPAFQAELAQAEGGDLAVSSREGQI